MADLADITGFEVGLLRRAGRMLASGYDMIDDRWFDDLVMRTVENGRDWRDLSAPQSRFRLVAGGER